MRRTSILTPHPCRSRSLASPSPTSWRIAATASPRRAIDDGADIIETDRHLTRDDVFVCIHDATLDRTTDGHGAVADLTLVEIKRYSASYGRPEFAAERIPALDELTSILPPDVFLALELKTDRFLEPDVACRLIDQLHAADVADRAIVLTVLASFAPMACPIFLKCTPLQFLLNLTNLDVKL